jgi:hypothetical protein
MTETHAPRGRNEPGSGALDLALHSANPSEGDPSRSRALLLDGEGPFQVPPELERLAAGRLRLAAREAAACLLVGAADLPPAIPSAQTD